MTKNNENNSRVIEKVVDIYENLNSSLDSVLVGQKDAKRVIASSLLCDTNSRILLTGNTGMGKTTVSRACASAFDSERIHMTSDVLPSDIQNQLKDKQNMEFLRVEEFNRASGKVQSVFIEFMEDHQMTIDGEVHRFGDFYVVASQNTQDISGVFNVPQAVYDRFDVAIEFDKMTEDEKRERLFGGFVSKKTVDLKKEDIAFTTRAVNMFQVSKAEEDLLMRVFNMMDELELENKQLFAGSNIRAQIFHLKLAKLIALASGRDQIIPSDIACFIESVYRHRIDQNVARIGDPNVKSLFEETKDKVMKMKCQKRGILK